MIHYLSIFGLFYIFLVFYVLSVLLFCIDVSYFVASFLANGNVSTFLLSSPP